jgi:LysR family transcriptional regulator, transcriptional activator of nhaA
MSDLNYHHLRYFWVIAQQGNLTRAAAALHVSPSALSIQLRQLEDRLGQALFERQGRQLVLTEAGRITLDHADTIFRTGQELLSTLRGRPAQQRPLLRVGAVSTLSRNFQASWLAPLLVSQADMAAPQVRLQSGALRELLVQLAAHTLDVVLTNEAAPRDRAAGWVSRRIAQQPLALVSVPPRGRSRRGRPAAASASAASAALSFPHGLAGQSLVLPAEHTTVRQGFDQLLEEAGVRVDVLAEVDDMAMMRLLALRTGALTLVPPVVVQDELASGSLVLRAAVPGLSESFYAITTRRRFAHPTLAQALGLR